MADVGVKLKVDGEKEFRQAIKDCNTTYKELGSELKLTQAEYDKTGKKKKYLKEQAELLTKMMVTQREKVQTLSEQLDRAEKEYGENSAKVQELKTKLNDAKTALVNLESQSKKNTKETRAFTQELEKQWDVVKKAGAAFGAAMTAVGAAAVTAGKKIFDMASDVSVTADNIDKMSQKIGISAEAFQEWDYVFKLSGTDVSNLQTGMKELSGIIVDAGNGSEGAAAKLSAVGLSIDDMAGKTQTEQLQLVITALQKMESGAERTAAATDLLGKSATDMAALLNMSAEETDRLKQEAHDYGMVMSDEAVTAGAVFNDSLTRLQDTISGLKNSFVAELLPSITMIMDGIAGLVAGKDEAVETLKNGVQEAISAIAEVLPQVISLLPPLITTVLNALIELFPSLVEVTLSLFNSLLDILFENLPALIPLAFEAIMTVTDKLISSLPEVINAAMMIIKSLAEGLNQALPTLIPAAISAILTVCTSLLDNLPSVLEAGLQLIVGLGNGLLMALPDLIARLPEIIGGIVDFLIEGGPLIVSAGMEFLGGILRALPMVLISLVEALGGLVTEIANALMSPDSLSTIADAGMQLIYGLWDGICSVGQWLFDQIGGFFGGIGDFVCGIFGIHSPSTVFAGIGKNLMLGMEEGIDKESKTVLKDVNELAGNISDAMTLQGSISVRGTRNGSAPKAGNVINIYPQELSNSTVDYLFQRFNAQMGATV